MGLENHSFFSKIRPAHALISVRTFILGGTLFANVALAFASVTLNFRNFLLGFSQLIVWLSKWFTWETSHEVTIALVEARLTKAQRYNGFLLHRFPVF